MIMAAAKGNKYSPGRPAGAPNKATYRAREAIAALVDGNIDRLNAWLDQIAAENPKDAFNCFMSVVDYHIPRLARSEVMATVDVKDHNRPEHKPILDRYYQKHYKQGEK